ncbi:hypothetical protein [Morganella morganii]|uniref:hypothetical protein n=1 Tax=Morganella morganii TaxID=582 RepID=UPI0013CCE054|nr:hypothetical protein [Morganella morganii]NGE94918.1 hypothetical protein [Morganella morganii]
MIKKYNQNEVKGRNFISDPCFDEWDNEVWDKGEPGKYARKEDGDKTYLRILGKGSISQSVILPKRNSGNPVLPPSYSLSFDYFIEFKAAASIILKYIRGGDERNKEEIFLQNEKEWCQKELSLNVSEEDTEIKFEFYAGKSGGNKALNLTAVDMQLHIGGFSPESIVFDHENIPADKPQLRLNYGRKHILNIRPSDDSAWRDLDCVLKWGSETPPSNYPISFDPELNTVQSLKKEGSDWKISCLAQKVSGIPETFNIMLASEYSAVPFVFDAEIGDYLYKFTEPKITGIAVIAQNIPAEVSIRVVCDYDEEYPDKPGVPDVDVLWKIDGGKSISTTKTDNDGMAALTFLPEQGGNYKLVAVITDKAGRKSRHQFDINVYDRSPWLDDTRIDINSTGIDYQDDAAYLMTGTTTVIHLNCENNENIFGRVKLENKEGNTGTSIIPAEGRDISPEGLSWDVNITGRDSRELTLLLTSDQFDISQEIGVITLQPDCDKEIQSLKVNGEEANKKTPLIIIPATPVTLNCRVNKLLSRLQAELNSEESKLLTAEPAFGQLQVLNNNAAEWVLRSAGPQGGFFNLDLNIPPLTIPLTLSGRALPQEIASGIELITLNNTPLTTPGNLFLAPGRGCTLTVKPHPLLKDIPVSLVAETSNEVSVISNPPFGQEVSLAENGTSWQISADPASARGKFSLQIQSQWGGAPVHLDGVVLSADLQDEGSVCVTDGDMGRKYDIDFNIGFAFLALELYSLDLKLLPDNLISGQTVSWELTEGDNHRDTVSFDPEIPIILDSPETDWEFSYSEEESTQFDLVLNSQDKFSYKIPCHIFSDEKYLEKSQCIFMLNDSVITPGINNNNLEYKKEISLKLKLSQEISAFLNGMVLALVVHKTDDEGDSLNITSDKLITVDKNKPDLEWSVETDVAVGHRFTLEIVLENLKNIRAVMKFTSV